ncbi:hypothetical protein [Bacillus thuringiensis]|uniref:hypothetical protein n=1 Tax=Bacillus thuringiensis TaxID=1428 RepID=UPI000C20D66F|nr:hypothetical protein [Bacillus thuringiensis]MEB9697257.1 hypothetical protein [Bacillus cereus]
MKLTNGYKVYEKGAEVEHIEGIPRIPDFMYSRYGWKIKELDGKKYWAAMDKEEYKKEVGKAFGISPSEVKYFCGSHGDTGCDRLCGYSNHNYDRFCVPIGGPDTRMCHCIG